MGKKIGLILTIGLATEPSIKRINLSKPDFVYFIHSKKSKENTLFIIEETGITNYKFKCLDDHESVDDTFIKSLECIFELQEGGFDIIGDFTVGTKAMSAGLVLACTEKKCEYVYLGESSDDARENGMGPVKSGFEKSKDQENPFENYAINEFKRAKHLFNKYQFIAARDNFRLAESKLKDKELKERSSIFIKIVNLYENWDKFKDDIIELNGIKTKSFRLNEYLSMILDEINNSSSLYNYFNNEIPDFYNQLIKNKEFLDKKVSIENKITDSIKYYLPDLLNNASRRIDEGKYDDAVARLYRSVDLIAQIRLHQYGLVDVGNLSKDKSFFINKNYVKDKFNKNQMELINNLNLPRWKNNKKKFMNLGLYNNYDLLSICRKSNNYDDDFNKLTKKLYNNFIDLNKDVEKRNKSILAHGLMPIGKLESENLNKSVLKHSKIVFNDIDDNMDLAEFPSFPENTY